MKKNKIRILTSEEMRKESLTNSNGQKSPCALSRKCADGTELECSGAKCEYDEEYVDGMLVLRSITCYNGVDVTTLECNNSGVTMSKTPEEACSGSTLGSSCQWRDNFSTVHYGTCVNNYGQPGFKLICDEAGPKSDKNNGVEKGPAKD